MVMSVSVTIERYRDPSVRLSHGGGAAAVRYRHACCLQLSHMRTEDPSADGRRSAASRTAILENVLGVLGSRRKFVEFVKVRECEPLLWHGQWRQREFKVGGTSLVSRLSACLTEANWWRLITE